jgi:hypothetical protein
MKNIKNKKYFYLNNNREKLNYRIQTFLDEGEPEKNF